MNRLDEYIVSVLTRMEVDDAQRQEIERELRAHLEEAISDGMKKGLSREQADEEAMVAFGDATRLARQFGAKGGVRWLWFERLTFGVFCTILVLSLPAWLDVAAVVAVWICVLKSAFDRVEVNGGLVVRRLGRRPLAIRFGEIEKVGFERGHLAGPRNILILHAGGRTSVPSRRRGMRAAAVALNAVVPESMTPAVREYLARLPLRVRTERSVVRYTLTIFWLTALIAILTTVATGWQGLGFGGGILLAAAIAMLLPIAQANFHADRSRVGVSWLLPVAALFGTGFIVMNIAMGSVPFARWGILDVAGVSLAGLALLWWRTDRKTLVSAAAFLAVAVILSRAFLDPGWPRPKTLARLGEAQTAIQRAHWTPDGRLVIGLYGSEEQKAVLLWGDPGGRFKSADEASAGSTSVTLLPAAPDGTQFVLEDRRQEATITSHLYRFDLDTGSFDPVERYPPALDPWVIGRNTDELWSPDGRKIVGMYCPWGADNRVDYCVQVVCDIVTGAMTPIKPTATGTLWEDNRTLRSARTESPEPTDPSAPSAEETTVILSRFDVETGKIEVLSRLVVPRSNSLRFLHGLEYMLLVGTEIEEAEMFQPKHAEEAALLDLISGEQTDLGPIELGFLAEPYAWDRDLKRLVYLRPGRNGQGPELIVFQAGIGEIARLRFSPGDDVSVVRPSPDGRRILYLRSRALAARMVPALSGRFEVWDIEANQTFPIRGLGFFEAFLNRLFDAPDGTLPTWSPDGREILYARVGREGTSVATFLQSVELPNP